MLHRFTILCACLGIGIASCKGAKRRSPLGDRSDTQVESTEPAGEELDERETGSEFQEYSEHDADARGEGEFPDANAESDFRPATDHEADHDLGGEAEEHHEEEPCTPNSYTRCDGDSYYWHNSCGARSELVETCLEKNTCRDISAFEARCCLKSTHQQCHQGSVYWFDECGFREDVAALCPTRNGRCVNLSDTSAECQCLNHWTGDACDVCPGNWDPVQDCAACREGWSGDDCTINNFIFLDPNTALMWEKWPRDELVTWQAGREYCELLELSGYSDWRLPSIGELRSIVRGCFRTVPGGTCGVDDDYTEFSCYVWEDCTGCRELQGPDERGCYWWPDLSGSSQPNRYCYYYWSSTDFNNGESAWFIYFDTGVVSYATKLDSHFARCARGP